MKIVMCTKEAADKYYSELSGAILRDIGFSDTKDNRRLLDLYGWYD